MVVHLCFALTVSIIWRLLFPTLCWSINTKAHLQDIVRRSFKLKLDLNIIPSLSN
jgi:hypothetical protein